MKKFMLIVLLGMLFSCTGKNNIPPGILKPEKMREVLWDYIRADVYASEYIKNDSSKNIVIENLKLQEKIFKIHHTSREEFYKSYNWYSNHKELMTNLMDSMVTRKQKEKIKVKPMLKDF